MTPQYFNNFKSKSALPNQFHDYIYRNIGETLDFEAKDSKFSLHADEARYAASANKAWKNNKFARHPGWHFFKNVESSNNHPLSISALFSAKKMALQRLMKRVIYSQSISEKVKVLCIRKRRLGLKIVKLSPFMLTLTIRNPS